MVGTYWGFTAVKLLSLWAIQYVTGGLVLYRNVKVNYTRKINHFALFFLPMYFETLLPYESTLASVTMTGSLTVLSLGIFVLPVRSRAPVISRMFLSLDRPEDRPNTLKWLSTQIAAAYLVIIPMSVLFSAAGISNLILIPILINGFGDGLAEPVGIRFGRLKYRAYALFSKKKYVRTVEGSACVFLTSIIVVLLFHSSFSATELTCALILMPIAMTLAEAFSPHTWDTPFLYFTGLTVLYLIKWLPLT